MRLVCVSDTHGLHSQVPVPPGDVLVHAGDLSSHGTVAQVQAFLDWFGSVGTFAHRVLIAGNHDFLFERAPALAASMIPDSVTYLNDSAATLGGLRFWGSPVTPTFRDWAFNRAPEQLARHWALVPPDTDVLVTHGPPRGILDMVGPGQVSVGCPLLAAAVARIRPRLHVFGHIHEGQGQRHSGGTRFVNAAICDARYQPVHAPISVDLPESGAGQRRPVSGPR